jgi:aldose sugar dehydrogenase
VFFSNNNLKIDQLMNTKLSTFTITFAVALSYNGLCQNSDPISQEPPPGKEIYDLNCSQCHGVNLQGGFAPSLTDSIWLHGSSKGHAFRNVKYGIPSYGMPAFEFALSDNDIRSAIDYIFDSGPGGDAVKQPIPSRIYSLDYVIQIDTVAEGLDTPWAMTFVSDETALITEKSGALRVMHNSVLHDDPVKGIPSALNEGQGGLLDVAVDPFHPEEDWVYLSFSHKLADKPGAMTKIVRGKIRDNTWTDEETLFEAPHSTYLTTRHHYGSRIVFDRNGALYFSIGDRGHDPNAQDISLPNGKIHRILKDGSIPKDNPFVGTNAAIPSVFAYGARNPQGLAVHPLTGALWEAEHGPMGGDELNLIGSGNNLGWPITTFGRNYNGDVISDDRILPGTTLPILYWKPSIAVCGIDFVQGSMFPKWTGKLLVGALKYEELRLLDIQDGRVLHQEILLKNAGRVRDVHCGPDGSIYVVLNSPGSILRLSPIRDMETGTVMGSD